MIQIYGGEKNLYRIIVGKHEGKRLIKNKSEIISIVRRGINICLLG